MRAAVTYEPGRMEVRDVSPPAPGSGEVLLETQVVGICGSDVHLFLGDHPYSRFPGVQGHEFSAVVAELGAGDTGTLQVGDLVAVEPLRSCGTCLACRRGHPNCCRELAVMGAQIDGALAEQIAAPAASCYPVGDLPADIAALVEPTSIGLQTVSRAGVQAGDQVVVLGTGPIGQTATLAAADRGARVLAVDILPNRLAIAAELGAEVTVNSAESSAADAVHDWAGPDGPAIVIDATGLPSLIRMAVEIVAHSGTVVIVGITTQQVSLPVTEFTRKELNVLGSRNNAGLFGESVDLVSRHRERAAQMISHRFGFADVAEAVQLAADHPDEAAKVLVRIGAAGTPA
jgi:L-gulonate 5-dehydrogenase